MQAWISLRTLLDNLDSETEFGNLDPFSQRALEWIAIRNQSDDPLYVQEIVMKSQIASPATVHKVISNLERAGMISITTDTEDTRRRVVKITARADKLFSQLSKVVEAWRRSPAETPSSNGKFKPNR